MDRKAQAGFTLLETLVALAVLAVSASFLLSATEAHLRNTIALSDRKIALWVAQNRLAELAARGADQPEVVDMAGGTWRISTSASATSDPDLMRFDVAVANEAYPDAELARLTTFLDGVAR